MSLTNKFVIHYFLKDGSHSMDAILKNKCDAEYIALANELIDISGVDIQLRALASEEGGLKELYEWFTEDYNRTTAILMALTFVFTVFNPVEYFLNKSSNDLKDKQARLEIEKLEKELGYTEEVNKVEWLVQQVSGNHKIETRRSNFYKELCKDTEITKIGFYKLDCNNKVLGTEVIVPRSKFPFFVTKPAKLPVDVVENARITIVAPVISDSNKNIMWKGTYLDNNISFDMNDSFYKAEVLAKRVSFKSGDVIECELHIYKKLNSVGEVVTDKFSVETVLNKLDGMSSTFSNKNLHKKLSTQNHLPGLDL